MNKRAFTLMELLASLAVISIIATITTVSYSRVIEGNKISNATNGASSLFQLARAHAITENKFVLVAFRPVLIKGGNSQQVEMVAAELEGSYVFIQPYSGDPVADVIDKYVPVSSVPSFRMPEGISVAYAPYIRQPDDAGDGDVVGGDYQRASNRYLTGLSYLPSLRSQIPTQLNEFVLGAGQFGLLFNPEGRLVPFNLKTGALRLFVDFDLDGKQDVAMNSDNSSEASMDPITYPSDIPSLLNPGFEEANFYGDYARFFAAFDNSYPWDEGWIQQRMSFAIYDDAKLRDSVNSLEWTTASGNSGESVNQRIQDHTSFVLENGIFFNFNRFTGELLE